MAYTKYSLTPADNNAAPPNGAPEGMLPSAVNDTMRDMMSQIRDVGDGIRGGTYTMTAPVITGGSITGVALSGNTLTNPVITGGSINNTTVGATTRSTGAFTTLASNGATTFTAGTASTSTTTGTAVITGGLGVSGRINAANFDGIVGANTAAAGKFTTLEATGVATFSAGTVSAPAITTTGDTNTGIFFPAADTIAFTEGGVESMRIDSAGNLSVTGLTSAARFVPTGSTLPTNGMYLPVANTIGFATTTTEQMRITSTGDVGIGTSSPAAKLDVVASGNTSTGIRIANTGAGGGVQTGLYPTNGTQTAQFTVAGTGYFGYGAYTAGNALIRNTQAVTIMADEATTGIIKFATGGNTERMRIDSSGNVGIGTSSPPAKFTVSATGAEGIEIYPAFSSTNLIQSYNRSGAAYTTLRFNALTYEFQGSGTERMRIDSAGNVGIGTSSPDSKLHVVSGSVASLRVGYNDTSVNYFDANNQSFRTGAGANIAQMNTYGIGLGATQPSSGMGIAFPATQSASSDANTLDDYEEGTWTPVLTPSTSGTITITSPTASMSYVKIGSVVTLYGIIIVSSISSPVGDLRLTGLPFVNTSSATGSTAAPIFVAGFGTTTTVTTYQAAIDNGVASTLLIRGFNNGVQVATVSNNVQANSVIYIHATYRV